MPLEPRQSRKRNPLLEKVISCYRSLGPILLANPGRTNSPHRQNNNKMTSRSILCFLPNNKESNHRKRILTSTALALEACFEILIVELPATFWCFLFGGVNSLRLMKIYLPLTNYPRSKVHSQAWIHCSQVGKGDRVVLMLQCWMVLYCLALIHVWSAYQSRISHRLNLFLK